MSTAANESSMKSRKYFNLCRDGRIVETVGYPVVFLGFKDIEFAVVRPLNCCGTIRTNQWQVIHVQSGRRVMFTLRDEPTRELAIASAHAAIERAKEKYGWVKTVRKAKRTKTPCIVAALEGLK